MQRFNYIATTYLKFHIKMNLYLKKYISKTDCSWFFLKVEQKFIIKPGLPEGRSDQGGRAVELGGG